MTNIPEFDPNAAFEAVEPQVPAFDPNAAFEAVEPQVPAFDPTAAFEAAPEVTWQDDLRAGILAAQQGVAALTDVAPGILDMASGAHGLAVAGEFGAELQQLDVQIADVRARLSDRANRGIRPQLEAEFAALNERKSQLELSLGAGGADARAAEGMREDAHGRQSIVEGVQRIGELGTEIAQIPQDPAAMETLNADTFGGAILGFLENPGAVTRTALLRSLPAMAPTVAATVGGFALGGPGGAAAAGGTTGGTTEYAMSVSEGVQEALRTGNVDPLDAAAVEAFFEQNPDVFSEVLKDAAHRAGIIGAVDAASGGLAGKLVQSAKNGGRAARAGAVVAGGATEAVGEGAGEAAASYAAKGEISPGEVLAETIAGGAMGLPQTAAMTAVEAARGNQPAQAENTDAPAFDPNADFDVAQPEAAAAPEGEVAPDVQPETEVAAAPEPETPAIPETQPETPAPDVQPEADAKPAAPRRTIYTPDNEPVEVETAVVEADTLLTSDQDGYPQELQPRDRDRAASQAQIEGIANAPNPARLNDDAPETDRGAPITGPDGSVIESGNGRVIGLRRAYERGTAEDYRAFVTERHPEAANMKNPVLVRRRVSDVDAKEFTVASNTSATLDMSASEQAQADARLINDDVLARYKGGEVGSAPNRNMVRAFIAALPQSAQNSLTTADGGLSVDGQRRFQSALFHRAYGDERLLTRLTESMDDDTRSITNAMVNAAPGFARLASAIERGEVSPDVDLSEHLRNAVGQIADMRSRGMNLRDHRAQTDAFADPNHPTVDALLDAFYNEAGTRLASKRDMQDFLEEYVARATEQRVDQETLPGVEAAPVKTGEAIANEINEAKRQDAAGGDLFADAAGPANAAGSGKSESRGQAEPEQVVPESVEETVDADTKDTEVADTKDTEVADTKDTEEPDTPVRDASRAPRGGMTPKTEDVSFTKGAAVDEQAWVDAGIGRDKGQLLKPAQKKKVLADLLTNTFGFFNVNLNVPGAKIETLYAVDQMLDAYRGLRFMLHSLDLPLQAISLGGTLSLKLEKFKGRYLGMYDPSTRSIHMPGRSNSFAHEWFHALDHYLLDQLNPSSLKTLLSQAARSEGIDTTQKVENAFVNVIYKMFFDEADMAVTMMRLEADAAQTIKKGPDAGKPTKKAIKAKASLDKLRSGATRMHIDPSAYRTDAQNFQPGSDYWGSVHEMMARAFEAYIGYKVAVAGGENAFITKGNAAYLSDADKRLAMTFPKASERMAIFAAFDELMDHIRADALLGTGPGASKPTNENLTDKQYMFRMLEQSGDYTLTEGFQAEVRHLAVGMKNLIRSPIKSLKNTTAILSQNLGVNENYGSTFEAVKAGTAYQFQNFMSLFRSVRGMTNWLINRQDSPDVKRAFEYLAAQLMTDPGTGKERLENHAEEVQLLVRKTASRIEAALKTSGLTGWVKGTRSDPWSVKLSKKDNLIVRELMFGNGHPDATKAHEKVAADLRRVMDEFWRTAKDAGLQVGYVEDKGYLTRVLLTDRVDADRTNFLSKAAEVYEIQFGRLVEDISVDDLLTLAAGVSKRVFGAEHLPVGKGPFGKQYRAVAAAARAVTEAEAAVDAAKKAHAKKPWAATRQALSDATAKLTAARKDFDGATVALKDAIRGEYSTQAADAWMDKIIRGESVSFDTIGPAADFMKARTLPPEADEILADFYDPDVLRNVMSYAMHTSAKAGYVKRFGQTNGHRFFRDVIARENVREAVAANPDKYDRNTAKGRFNIVRDLANPATDNITELMLEQAAEMGASIEDVRKMRETVELLTGRTGKGFAHNTMRAVASFVTVWGALSLLGKAALSSVAEPLVVGLRTGSVQTALKTFQTYLTEAVRTMDSVQERAAFAKAMGLISSPLYDVTMLSRAGVDPKDALAGNMVLTRFFRATGLTQVTNASRRAALVGGTFWLTDLSKQYMDPKTKPAKLEKIKAEFRDLGLDDRTMTDMAEFLISIDGKLPEISDLDTPQGQLFEKVMNRFVSQTIQEPSQADKPALAASPLGRVAYALTSFLYTFTQNIHAAAVKRANRNYEINRGTGQGKLEAGLDAYGGQAATFALGFAGLFMGQLAASIVREAVLNQDQWDKHEEEGDLDEWLMQLALSRTGAFGLGDVLLNALTGLRYERDLTSLFTGAYAGNMLSHTQNILKGLPKTELWEGGPGVGARNSDNTITAEHTAAKSAYLLLIAPAMNGLLSATNAKGPLTYAGRYGLMTYLSSYSAAGDFADTTVGEK